MKRYIINKYRYMEAFSHFISTDDCTAHSCRRTGRRGCLSCTPTLHLLIFFFPSLYFPPKGNQKRKSKCPVHTCEASCKKMLSSHASPSLLRTPTKQEIPRVLRQSAGFLRSRTRLGGAEQPGCSLGQVRSRVPSPGAAPTPRARPPPLPEPSVPAFEVQPGKIN